MTPVGDPATPSLTCLGCRTSCPSAWRTQYLRALEVEREDQGRESHKKAGGQCRTRISGSWGHQCLQMYTKTWRLAPATPRASANPALVALPPLPCAAPVSVQASRGSRSLLFSAENLVSFT